MRALVVDGPGRAHPGEAPDPVPGPGEALIDVRVAGICGTDLQLVAGYMGFHGIPGHEFVGTVTRVSSPHDHVLLGARVVGEINVGCEDCPRCAQGLARHCTRRSVLGILNRGGAFAERIVLPVSNLHAVPEGMPDEVAVFTEPLAAAFEILDQITLPPAQRVLVLGDGRLGILIARTLAAAGARIVLAGHHRDRLERWASAGITPVLAPEGIPSDPFECVVEATGTPGGLQEACARVRARGTVVLKSTCAEPTTFDASRVVVDEITVVGSRCGRFQPALSALRDGSVAVGDLVTESFPLERAVEALETASQSGSLKVLLRVGS